MVRTRIVVFFLTALITASTCQAQQKQILTVTATSCSSTNSSCLIYTVDPSTGAAIFTVSSNSSGNTLQFEATGDGGQTWVALNATPSNGTSAATSTSSTGSWQANVAAYTAIRVRMSSLVSGSSTVSIVTSLASARPSGGSGNLHGTGAPMNPCSAGTTYTDDSTGNLYSCNSGIWQIVTTSGGGVTATAGQTLYASATNSASGGSGVIDLSGVSGADLGAKMNNCMSLGTTPFVCDGSNLTGSLTLSSAVTTNKPVTFRFCGQSVSQSANVALANSDSAVIGCAGRSTTFTKAGNIDQFTLSGGNAYTSFLTLVGVSGSFTGKGIVETSSSAIAEFNVVTGEASDGIAAGPGTAQFNTVSSSTSAFPITSAGGNVSRNSVTATASDAIHVTGNSNTVERNNVSLSPAASTSGLCAINFNGDQIQDQSLYNRIQISDTTNSGNVDKGVCFTPITAGHNLNMLSEGDTVTGILSGSVTTYGWSINNAAGINTGWSLLIRDPMAVHIGPFVGPGAPLQDVDAQNNPVVWEDDQTEGSVPLIDGTTTGTNIIYLLDNRTNYTFATLPTSAGNGSRVFCTNCLSTSRQPIVGAGGNLVTRINGSWVGASVPAWAFVQAQQHAASATTTSLALTNHNNPGDTLLVGAQCTATGSPTLAVSDTANGAYSQDFAPVSDGANHWIALFRFSNISGAAGGTNTVTISSSGNTCSYVNLTSVTEYSGVGLPDGTGTSATGTGTVISSGALTVTKNDLVVGVMVNFSGLINPASGCGQTCRPGSGDFESIYEDVIGPASGTQAMTAGANSSGAWVALAFAYKLN